VTVAAGDFIDAMRLLPAGVTIVTSIANGRRSGFTATAVCSVAAEPPHILICANRSIETRTAIVASGLFAVNVLRADQAALADLFAGRTGRDGEERFVGSSWKTLETGAPILPNACAVFDCRVVKRVPVATHDIIVGQVVDVRSRPPCRALLYVDRLYARIATNPEISSK
jgi:flavin reductase (DIM6/NTAB) family NADH-FMN oxidoreductase RutF